MYFLLFFTAVVLSCIAAYYSVIGLIAIFSAAVIPVAIMGTSLEVAKLVVASWLYRFWKHIPWLMKVYFMSAIIVLMLITSMGIFGFLSKAHNDQNLISGEVQSKIAIYDEKIKTAKENIESNRKQLKQMDEAVDQVMARSQDEKGADKANAIRKSQSRDRIALAKDIEANQKLIVQLNDEAAPIRAEVRKVEAEVGPIKYIAALIYEDNPNSNNLEKAVRFLIIILIFVFDPLAVLMLIAANLTQIKQKELKENEKTWLDDQANELTEAFNIDKSNEKVAEELQETTNYKIIPEETTIPTVVETPVPSEPESIPCYKCGTELVDVPGIGLFCPNKSCDIPDTASDVTTPDYELDDGALTEDQLNQIKESVEKHLNNTNNEENIGLKTEPAKADVLSDEPIIVNEDLTVDQTVENQVTQMIENDDQEGLEAVYKKIVKELAKKNRKKNTHWGS
jgi:hypothetical protein